MLKLKFMKRRVCHRCEILHRGSHRICVYCELELKGISLPIFPGQADSDTGFIVFASNNGLQQLTRRIAHDSLSEIVDRWHWRLYDVGR